MKDRWKFRTIILLALAVLAPILLGFDNIPLAHAVVTFKSNTAKQTGDANCLIASTTCQISSVSVTITDLIIVNVDGLSSSGGGTTCPSGVTDDASNSYTKRADFGDTVNLGMCVWTASASTTAVLTITITWVSGGFTWQVSASVYSGVVGFGATSTDTSASVAAAGTSNFVLSGITGTVYEVFSMKKPTGSSCVTIAAASSQTERRSFACIVAATAGMTGKVFDKTAPLTSLGVSWSGGDAGTNEYAHYVLELLATAGPQGQVSQCYGNCGNPAVTTVNTNSTYSLNFNNSITIFYEAQSALQGTINNITAIIAKAYSNNVFFTLAIYRVDRACTNTNLPFTSQCPALYAYRQSFIIATPKGKLTAATNIAVDMGQWFGIAFTATFSPPYPNAVALNDTNTAVQLFQAPGSADNLITNPVALASSFKPALYSWVTGTTVIVGPPPAGIPTACPGLDCILPNIVNSFCTTLTTACQTASGLFWLFILTFISIALLAYVMVQVMPGVNLAKIGLGEMGILLFVGWLVLFTSLSLIQGFVIILVFLVVSWLFIGRIRGTGPI